MDCQPALAWIAEEHVTREKRERKVLDPVLPAVSAAIERKKHFEPFGSEGPGDVLLVLVTSVECVPPDRPIRFLARYTQIRHFAHTPVLRLAEPPGRSLNC